jgi:hypothetical protein
MSAVIAGAGVSRVAGAPAKGCVEEAQLIAASEVITVMQVFRIMI